MSLKADYPAEELIRQLREGGIRILVTDIIGNQARVGIEAPRGVLIVRDELKTAPKG
ncbi:TPA: carbon storage regulator [Pseudomonas aeruginosa]|nr:carbon storage regulator [Pseudomonas aeruginosa]